MNNKNDSSVKSLTEDDKAVFYAQRLFLYHKLTADQCKGWRPSLDLRLWDMRCETLSSEI